VQAGFNLLQMIDVNKAPRWLREVQAVEVLRRVWVPQWYPPEGPVRWRAAEDLPPSVQLLYSPDDAEARYSKKRSLEWTGDNVPLTETCADETPHLMTDVQTTPAPTADFDRPPMIQATLPARQLLPSEPDVDTGVCALSTMQKGLSREWHEVNL
jgi:transposase